MNGVLSVECAWCKGPMPEWSGRGRPPRYCSTKCRHKMSAKKRWEQHKMGLVDSDGKRITPDPDPTKRRGVKRRGGGAYIRTPEVPQPDPVGEPVEGSPGRAAGMVGKMTCYICARYLADHDMNEHAADLVAAANPFS